MMHEHATGRDGMYVHYARIADRSETQVLARSSNCLLLYSM